jgi:hypothetical protein
MILDGWEVTNPFTMQSEVFTVETEADQYIDDLIKELLKDDNLKADYKRDGLDMKEELMKEIVKQDTTVEIDPTDAYEDYHEFN